ncbi:MAG: bifunctional riboflavin kinase/FAD synthetase [Dehalococcoidia bacterium]|nr:bifunctional riboflavin kinase/FAD synthetase [Dehalococcoidia bacterium]
MSVADELAAIQPAREMALTIGVFDGVHPGHQHLINRLKEKSVEMGLLSGVITFSWHPKALLAPQTELPYLTSLEERIRLIKALGIDHVIVLSFTSELSQLTAREFVILMQKHLKMRALVIGPDFALGKGREGNFDYLSSLGKELNFTVDAVHPIKLGEKVISSTAIRRALAKGDVENVSQLLGRRFRLSGTVVHGDHRGGKLLGFPTTNLSVVSNSALPADGAYVTLAHTGRKTHKAVTNIGVRPTFGKSARTIETHILDFKGNLYDHAFSIEFVKRLRGEIKFDSLDKLKEQIRTDILTARSTKIERSAGYSR